jgi:hypothetical protein
MNKTLPILVFTCSACLGWWVSGGESAVSLPQAAESSSNRLERKREAGYTTHAREAEFEAFAKRVPTISREDRKAFSENLTPQERAALLDVIIRQGDPGGFSAETKDTLSDIINAWAAKDFAGAWAWSQQLGSKSCRNYVASALVERMTGEDLPRALALHLEMSAADPTFYSNVPTWALMNSTTSNASDFLDLLGKLNTGGSISGVGCDFAKNFDFQRAAEGVNTLLENTKKLPSAFPLNFYAVWAERDPDAAMAWFANHNGGFERFSNLLEGVEKQGIPGAASAWAASKIQESETFRKVIVDGLANNSSAAEIDGVVKALPDSKSRDQFLTELFVKQPANFAATLAKMSSPQARLEAFEQVKKGGGDFSEKISEAQYQAWGVTRQQFEAVFSPTKKP